ncbi:uncharacterized protein I303_108123 [Kwoniella dejecticola CBS 10117]|uniref:Fe2OG dioxygenase domain-containing protein n=1 Tax=Kwoniella dejecticola CBS 10117 TaxID=1296121 RepID=A0A1A5ZY92_9TREE|nr:uncharacterized protein I303_07550 [Kwoniella dejecticola CBS 10117]OBR82782.1 hypothetical protein I303_07550 [Kwoniella dejecticola CBS 10117]
MAAPFNPPAADLPGKPQVTPWVPPPTSKLDIDWAKLRTIDLSLLDSPDPKVVQDLVDTCRVAIRDDGFIFLEDYGVSIEQLHRQFDIAQYLHQHISDEDKERLHWNPDESGTFAGWKPMWGWRKEKGNKDNIEHFNYYQPQFESMDRIPTCMHPFWDEIVDFCNYLTYSVNKRLLKLLSKVLEMPDDFLWDLVQSKVGPVGQGYFRQALYYASDEVVHAKGQGTRMNGHCDFGTTTMLFSVPISSLQIWGRDEQWRYVPYKPGALVINIGETLELVSGGHFRATRHRVVDPPSDQQTYDRLSIVLFQASEGDLRMEPAYQSPLLQREGCFDSQGAYREFKRLREKGIPIPTNREWREVQIADAHHATDAAPRDTIVMVNGQKHIQREYMGVNILLPA